MEMAVLGLGSSGKHVLCKGKERAGWPYKKKTCYRDRSIIWVGHGSSSENSHTDSLR